MTIKPIETNDSAHGSAREWDAIWKKVEASGSARSKGFTRSTPQDIYQFWQRCYFDDLLQIVRPKKDWDLLELASGRGTTSMYLASHGFKNITLVDLSEKALEQARRNFDSEQLPEPKIIVGDAEATGLPDQAYDLVYNIGVLEHFEDPSRFLRESLRLLKPGGWIFMPIVPQMPYSHSLVCRTLLDPLSLAKQATRWMIGWHPPESTMVRTKTGASEYRHLATREGFGNVECIPYNPYWKLRRDGSILETRLDVPLYRAHNWLKKQLGFRPGLRTWSGTSLCLLLTGQKL